MFHPPAEVSQRGDLGTGPGMNPTLPRPIGPLSEHLDQLLRSRGSTVAAPIVDVDDPLADDDLHRALYCCYELHYRGFDGVPDDAEWDPAILAYRGALERAFEAGIRGVVPLPPCRPADLRQSVVDSIENASGPSLSSHMVEDGTLDEMREFAVHRSAYQLKEADPHTWAIPRLAGDTKAALVHIQADEYGFGRPTEVHSTLFAGTMRTLGLDDTYGAYLHLLPGTTLATVNLVSMFGLHRRLRAATLGHLAVFEMTSVIPMGRYADALTRLGMLDTARRFYDVHVIADADHEIVALDRMVYAVERDDPALAVDVLFGARAVLEIERRFAESLLGAWAGGGTALRVPATAGLRR
jgi:hypothetical protein